MSAVIDLVRKVMIAYVPKLYVSVRYFKHRKKFPRLRNPGNISEFILSNICSGDIYNYATYVDKLAVRSFIRELGFETYLPRLYGTWESAYDIDFKQLPERFALKTNHGCGSHYLCSDRGKLNEAAAVKIIDQALHTDFGAVERQYRYIEPKCYAEEYLSDPLSGQLLDYKFMCFEGKPRCVLVCSDRTRGSVRLKTYDLEWKQLDWIHGPLLADIDFEKPKSFDEMVHFVEIVAANFPFVRVDLYSLSDGRVVFGELTFTPQGGVLSNFTSRSLELMVSADSL